MSANKRVVFITRSTLHSAEGGDTFQVMQTARHLGALGIDVDIRLTDEKIDYSHYDLLHFFNIIRPADILCHIQKSGRPYAVSTLLIDYTAYDRQHRKGLAGMLFGFLSGDAIEYMKTIGRFLGGNDKIMSPSYLWKGQKKAVREILSRASLLFSNSVLESNRLTERYDCPANCVTVPNGLDTDMFVYNEKIGKDPRMVLCVARIEGIKNQLNLIRALNNTGYQLFLVGSAAPNQASYYRECRRIAGPNVHFIEHVSQEDLIPYYQKAKVHILPSWFEVCGLATLEAGAMGCNIVITDKGYTREYYEDYAFYCDPGEPDSILKAVQQAAGADRPPGLREKILSRYTWQQAAVRIASAYNKLLN